MTNARTTESIRAAIAALTEQRQTELAKAAELKAKHAEQAARVPELTEKQREAWANLPVLESAAATAADAIARQLSELANELIVAEAGELAAGARTVVAEQVDLRAKFDAIAARVLTELEEIKTEDDAHTTALEEIRGRLRAHAQRHGEATLAAAGVQIASAPFDGFQLDGVQHRVQWLRLHPDLISDPLQSMIFAAEERRLAAKRLEDATARAERRLVDRAREQELAEEYRRQAFPEPSAADRAFVAHDAGLDQATVLGAAILNN